MIAVLKHELSGYFHSLTAYIFGAFLMAFVGIGAMIYNIQQAVANFEYVLSFVSLAFVVLVPILTMRVIAEERKQKTDQLLYSLPITSVQVVAGKYLALLAVYFIPLCIVSIYPWMFARYGEVYLPASYGSIAAFFMMGAALISVGMFISSLTENLGFAAGIAISVSTAFGSVAVLWVLSCLLGVMIRFLTGDEGLAYGAAFVLIAATEAAYWIKPELFEGLLPELMKQLSLFERFYTFVSGVFDLTSIVYYCTVIGFFLFLTVQSLEKRRYH